MCRLFLHKGYNAAYYLFIIFYRLKHYVNNILNHFNNEEHHEKLSHKNYIDRDKIHTTFSQEYLSMITLY